MRPLGLEELPRLLGRALAAPYGRSCLRRVCLGLPTIITVATWPILIAAYYRLARREEREAEAMFGDAYRIYEVRVPNVRAAAPTSGRASVE